MNETKFVSLSLFNDGEEIIFLSFEKELVKRIADKEIINLHDANEDKFKNYMIIRYHEEGFKNNKEYHYYSEVKINYIIKEGYMYFYFYNTKKEIDFDGDFNVLFEKIKKFAIQVNERYRLTNNKRATE